jgi:hypothetical protein
MSESREEEVNMSRKLQPIISAASLICGLTLMALVFSIQREPLAWTQVPERTALAPAPTSAPKDELRSDALEWNTSPASVVEVPEVRITSAKPAVPRETKSKSEASQPCSEWRELGPAYVEDGQPRGTRRVRNLC